MRLWWLLSSFLICGCAVDHVGFRAEPEFDASHDAESDAERPDVGLDAGGSEADVGSTQDMALTAPDGGRPVPDGGGPALDAGHDAGPRDAGDDAGPRDAGDDAPDPCLGLPDRDGDGIMDDCDRWPCGPEPVMSSPVMGEGITFSGVNLGGVERSHMVVEAGSELAISFGWELDDRACPTCVDFIEVGRVPGGRGPCIAGPEVGRASGRVINTLRGFSTDGGEPFQFDIRFNLRQDHSCGSGWWRDNRPPPPAQTFATICVVNEL